MPTFLLAFGALFSIVNPLSGAFIFFGATQGMEPKTRAAVSRWVAIYAFCIVAASLYVGAYVLSFFGISIPVLRVAGGIVVSMSGWRMLNEPDATEQRRSEAPAYPRSFDTPKMSCIRGRRRSASTISTFLRISAAAIARLLTTVVLPSPAWALVKTNT